jgi:apolipoprotein N-acyltransferase
MEASKMGLTGMGFSTVAIAAGAIMYWAVTYQGHGFRFSTIGVILMVVGAIGLVISTIVFAVSRRPAGGRRHAYDKQTIDADGRSTEVHEAVR